MIFIPEYWDAVARAIAAENDKAQVFIRHNASLGVAREAILRKVIVDHTPDPFRVQTGFVCYIRENIDTGEQTLPWFSKQYDLLVYDPGHSRPLYTVAPLVVVPRGAARCVVEVKSYIGRRKFREILDIWTETSWIPVPSFGFAYDGVKFTTFVQMLQTAIKDNPPGVPECIVVHARNYVFFRSVYRLKPCPPNPRHLAKCQFALNFGDKQKHRGRSTAVFLELYSRWLKNSFDSVVESELVKWFNRLELPEQSKVSIDEEGNIKYGAVQTS